MSDFIRLGKNCPICCGARKDHDCRQSHRTNFIHCRGRQAHDYVPGWRYVGEDRLGFPMWVDENQDASARDPLSVNHPASPPPAPKRTTILSARFGEIARFEALLERRSNRPLSDPARLFGEELGLVPGALHCMAWHNQHDLGAYGGKACWSTFEWGLVSGQIEVVALHLRYPRGTGPGGRDKITYGRDDLPDDVPRRGVFLPTDWHRKPGLILLPEGASDSITLTLMGIPAIGRPNNGAGGSETIAHLARAHGREVAVLIENDQKPDGRWPSLEGGQQAAHRLAELLGQPVGVVLPPDDAKDARQWFIDHKKHLVTNGGVCTELQLGEWFLDCLVLAETWQPGQTLPSLSVAKTSTVTITPNGESKVFATLETRRVPANDPIFDTLPPNYGHDLSDLEVPREPYTPPPDPIPFLSDEQVAALLRGARLNGPLFPCQTPTHEFHGLEVIATGCPLEIEKRCGKCHNCQRHRVHVNATYMASKLGQVEREGRQLYEWEFNTEQWGAMRQRLANLGESLKGYFKIDSPDGMSYLITEAAGFGSPVCAEGAVNEVRARLECAVPHRGCLYSSSKSWAKARLPQIEAKCRYISRLDPISEPERAEMSESVGAECRTFRPADDDKVISYRLYIMRGGWTQEKLDQFWIQRVTGVPGLTNTSIEVHCDRLESAAEDYSDVWTDT